MSYDRFDWLELHVFARLVGGGNTASPTLSTVGFMSPRNPRIAFFAQVSFVPPARHELFIEAVRSRTIMMFSGSGVPPAIAAVAFAETLIEPNPNSFRNVVGTLACSLTTIVFAGLQGRPPRHFVDTVVVTPLRFGTALRSPGEAL